jgi:hypothetical protein
MDVLVRWAKSDPASFSVSAVMEDCMAMVYKGNVKEVQGGVFV